MKKCLLSALLVISSIASTFATGHVATAIGTSPTCNGLCNGSAVAMAAAGVGPYGFTWTGPSGYTGVGANISGLCAGTYIVTAIDSSDMSIALYTLNLTQPSPLAAAANSPTICAGTTATLIANATGGTAGYTYLWSPATALSSTTVSNPLANPTVTTTYTVTITDANGCTATAVSTVSVIPIPPVAANSGSTCAGNPFSIFATGAMTYSWSTGATTNPLVVNPATTTTYTVTGSMSGCIATATATVTVQPVPVVTLSPSPATCGLCNGSITTSTSGAIAYSWVGPSGYTSTLMSPSGLCSGSYTVTATNSFGCTGTAVTFVSNASSVVATVGSITPASCGLCNGSATVFATGGTPPYNYLWSPMGITTSSASGLCSGVYNVTVTDQNGCTFMAVATIPNASTVTAVTSATTTACTLCNGSANVTASGGSGGYTYDWAPGVPIGDGTTSISSLCVGNYTVTVTDGSGCTATSVTTVNNSTPIVATASAMPATCGVCDGVVTVMQSGGTGPYLYDLTGFAQQTSGTFSGVCAGTYVATVTDANGCTAIYTIMVNSTNSGAISATASVMNETGAGMANGSINLVVAGSSPPFSFLWSNGATTEDIYSLTGGTYSVVVTDNTGACATYTFVVNTNPSYGYITGYAYNDNNSNCIFDAGDSPLAGYFVNVAGGSGTFWGYTNAGGYYSVWAPLGSYTVTPGTLANLEAGCTASYPVTVTSGSISINNNFAYTIPPVYDVCISVTSLGIVPGFNGSYNVNLHNYGNQTAIGVAYLVIPGFLNYVSSAPAASSISGDTIFWNYTINPYANQIYTVTFYCPPATPLGTVGIAYVDATVTNGTDINPGCNHYVYTRIVAGSFDPNAKSVSPTGLGAMGDIPLTETEFTYLVQFQNTGTGPAVNIKVTDTISAMLDLMSFEMLNASHPYVVEFLPGNVIRWKFDNIMLPDSTSDEAGSHGHVQFRISKLNAPAYGESITNKAFIYFDFNEAVITNTAVNTYSMATDIEASSNANGTVSVYPNPFNDNATFVIQSDKLNETYTFELTDVLGKKVKEMNGISQKQFEISRNGLQNGIYFYKIYSSESVVGMGKVIIK